MKSSKMQFRMNSGVNFSSLARNGGKFLSTQLSSDKIINTENSPARIIENRKVIHKEESLSPKWIKPGIGDWKPSSFQTEKRSKSQTECRKLTGKSHKGNKNIDYELK